MVYKIWKDKNISQATKVRLVRAVVFPIATYACETWTMRKSERTKINAFEHWCWRRLLRISWTEKRTNLSIDEQKGSTVSLENTITKHKLAYFEHVVRANGLEKAIMIGMGVEKEEEDGREQDGLTKCKQYIALTILNYDERSTQDMSHLRRIIMEVYRSRS